jgi:hypothetical protein
LLPDADDVTRELERLLAAWLVDEGEKGLRHPVATLPAATLRWQSQRSEAAAGRSSTTAGR